MAYGTAGQQLYARLYDLLQNAPTPFPFPMVEGGTPNNSASASYTLQATTMPGQRLAELYLSAESITNTQLMSDTDGSLRVGLGSAVFQDTTITKNPIVHLTSSSNRLTTDIENLPREIIAQITGNLTITNNTDTIQNYFTITRVGGAAQVATTSQSVNQFGTRALTRTDLICETDAQALAYANAVRTDNDAWTRTAAIGTLSSSEQWTGAMDQTLQPGSVNLTDQHPAQRTIQLGDFCVLDWYDVAATPKLRMIGRIVQIKETLLPTAYGINWSTDLTILSRYAYIPQ